MTDPNLAQVVTQGLLATLQAVGDHHLLDALEEPSTADELAARLGLSPRALGLVLPVLRAAGLLELRDGRFAASPAPDLAQDTWRRMDAFLRTGEVSAGIDDPSERGGFYEPLVTALGEVFRAAAAELAEQLDDVATVLDVGAGSGVWSLAMAARCAETRVTALDLAEVAGAFTRGAADRGLADRARAVAGDYWTTSFDQGFDRVVLANVLHLESEARAAALIARQAGHLVPGGELVVVDFFGEDGSRQTRVTRAIYALHLGMRTAVGKPHGLAELSAWCAGAGLRQQRLVPLLATDGAMSALVCR